METRYIAWLKTQPVLLFQSKGIYWRLYNHALLPASPAPQFLSACDEIPVSLLRASGAWFLRYTSDPTDKAKPWWYIVCDNRDSTKLSAKVRNQIRFANRQCSVERVDARWLGDHGYAAYVAAHGRYLNATPMNEATFRENVVGTLDGPIEYWGVFVGTELAGYCQCNVEENNVDIAVMRLHPAYLKSYTAYAMVSHLIAHYVNGNNIPLSNGERSVAHQTNFQEFLLKFGFRKQFCRLNIIYHPSLRSAMKLLYLFHRALKRVPDRGSFHNLRTLVFQEEIRRSCG